MNIWESLPKPFLVLAPMDDVTDSPFRQIVSQTYAPDVFYTEFVNADGLQSNGRNNLLSKLVFTQKERPLIVQIWGLKPENFYKTAKQIANGSLANEANSKSKHLGLDKVQGSKEKRVSRTDGTVSEHRTQLTQQFAKSIGRVGGSADKQANETQTFGGFDGVDLNMGCPVPVVTKKGACSALINNHSLAQEIIQATREGLRAGAPNFPLSVKTRIGFNKINTEDWCGFLLEQNLDALIVHGRTSKEMSKVPTHWDEVSKAVKLRDKIQPKTKVIGNGDISNRQHGLELAKEYELDGVMIGRGIFQDLHAFSEKPKLLGREESLLLYLKHIDLFEQIYGSDRNPAALKKFAKVYVREFAEASDLRAELMQQNNLDSLREVIEKSLIKQQQLLSN